MALALVLAVDWVMMMTPMTMSTLQVQSPLHTETAHSLNPPLPFSPLPPLFFFFPFTPVTNNRSVFFNTILLLGRGSDNDDDNDDGDRYALVHTFTCSLTPLLLSLLSSHAPLTHSLSHSHSISPPSLPQSCSHWHTVTIRFMLLPQFFTSLSPSISSHP